MASSANQQHVLRMQLVIGYWYRAAKSNHDSAMLIADLINIIIEYSEAAEILSFNKEFMEDNVFKFMHDNTMAIKIQQGNNYVIPDIEPITEGQICWRIKV